MLVAGAQAGERIAGRVVLLDEVVLHARGLCRFQDGREIERVARWYLDPLRMLIVAVGNAETIAPELRKLELGPLEVIEPDGT